jgi:2-polyprenyl-6-methoxyphenol hydroxylase-like FAD-dependent oxidoreductase
MKKEFASTGHQSQNEKKFGRAIVMGAGIAGLWTARALIDQFEEVLILERDHLPEGAEFRSGTPQARQFHALLESGLQQMKKWFPGLDSELIAAGAVAYDVTGDVHMYAANHWFPRFPSGSVLLSCSRLLLESSIRRRLRENPCVRFMEGVEVVGLQCDEEKRRVSGVRIQNRRHGPNPGEEDPVFEADLVVDALGRRSQSPVWLVEMGYLAPEENEVDSFLGYVTRRYKRKPNTPMIWILATPPDHPYGAILFPEENDTMMVLLSGFNKHYPPTDPEEFDAFLPVLGPEFEEALRGAEPISQPSGYRGTSSRWRHYEKLGRWPERFVVLGDAFCCFNPIYGQGMAVAAMSAVALADRIKRSSGNLDGVAKSALNDIGKLTQPIWLFATGSDLSWPDTHGGTLGNRSLDRFGRWYIGKLLDATVAYNEIRRVLVAVNQLTKPGTALFAPGIFLRVMKHALMKKLQRG